LYVVFALVALLGANSVYLVAITTMEWLSARRGEPVIYQNYFYQYMFLAHLVLGLILILPFVLYGLIHMATARNRPNRRAIRMGYSLFAVCLASLVTGVLLMRVAGFDLRHPIARATIYWLHVAAPLVAGWLYWLHRLAGPAIKWRVGFAYAAGVVGIVVAMVFAHRVDPRKWNVAGPKEGERYFFPSLARTGTGNFIPARTLMMDEYCKNCHADIYETFYHGVHHFSSFNNPAYLAAVRETREVAFKRDGDVKASRFCAGCHDPVPFFSGAFDDPQFDDVKHPTAHAGITCTVCHAISHVPESAPLGDSDYTIDEPVHYPFAFSDNPVLQFVNQQLIKAKPAFHKKTFLKPFHKTAEFCGTCHKVHLPEELNKYRWLRGQNHYDSFLLSGVSGHGARSFYYPPKAEANCNGCHMPLRESADFGAKLFDDSGKLKVHSHLFPAANTGVAWLNGRADVIEAHKKFNEGVMRVDIFGLREGGRIDGKLHAPIRPIAPALEPGGRYLLETYIRTVKMGHHFTQGTTDSNEVWLDVTVTSGGRVIGRSGGIDSDRHVDPWSHFVNVYMLDRHGNRIARRNAQDIFVPLYNHQIPPGAGQTIHYELALPEKLSEPVTVELKLQYRKFDAKYMDFVTRSARPGDLPIRGHEPGKPYVNQLPIMTLAADRVTFPVAGFAQQPENAPLSVDPWMRWNDYGIGLLLKGKAELRQAAEAFAEVEKLGRYDGPLNLARVYFEEGRLDDAVAALRRAAQHTNPAPPRWTLAWLTGLVNAQQGYLDEAIANLTSVLTDKSEEMYRRGFDFSKDYEVINRLGQVLFQRAKQERGEAGRAERTAYLRQAADWFHKTLALDSENVTAHYNLFLIYTELGETENAARHQKLHEKYRTDDNARDTALAIARRHDPAANQAAENVVIYSLHRPAAPGLGEWIQVDNRTTGGGGK
jgi:tetratricopeptide (TPR) repeat protein